MEVVVEFSQLPYSCSLCKAFGHSLARCHDNPNREVPPSKKPRRQSNNNDSTAYSEDNVHNDVNADHQETNNVNDEHENEEDHLLNRDMVPYVVGKFLSCDVVMDDDQILEQSMDVNQLENVDDLETFDNAAITE